MKHYLIQDYTPSTPQALLHRSKSKEILVVSSIRAGKSYAIIHDAIKNSWNNPTEYGTLICAPTYRLLSAVLEKPMVSMMKRLGLLASHNATEHEAKLRNGRIIYFRSLEDPDLSTRGLNVWKAYIDECALCTKYAVDLVKSRLVTTNGDLIMVTTPNGTTSWMYESYIEKRMLNTEYIKFSILDNPIITEEAVERLKESLDPLMFAQEVLGQWVNLFQDRIYHSFSEENVKEVLKDPNLPVYVGVDFNLGINAWSAYQRRPDNTIIMFEEGHGTNTTAQMTAQIIKALGSSVIIIPDATGGNKLQGTATTHFQLMRQAGLSNIVENSSNPRRLHRYANVNALLENALGQRRLLIDPKCVKTLAEFRKLSYKENTDKPAFDPHFTDAAGYAIGYLTGNMVGKVLSSGGLQSNFVRNFQRNSALQR